MKKVFLTSLFIVISLINILVLFTSPEADAATPPIDSINAKCYQTYGYCSAWEMGYMCTPDKTSEICHITSKGCKNCNDFYAPGFDELS